MRFTPVALLLAALGPGQHPTSFTAVDTSALMGSPDPIDGHRLERAFARHRFRQPVQVRSAPGAADRLFVACVRGRIFAFDGTQAGAAPTVFLDITDRVRFGGDSGLMAFAFEPAFERTGEVYVYYCARGKNTPIDAVLSRFKLDDTKQQLDPATEQVVLRIPQPHNDHKAGCIEFGPDGYLYFASGDGGLHDGKPTRQAQDPRSLLGTMVRIAPNPRGAAEPYTIPKGNPFVGDDAFRDEIWAYGLRAPWRFCFDKEDGTCWLGDNGQWSFDEVDIIVGGGNYGWPDREGFGPYDPDTSGPGHRRGPPRGSDWRFGKAPDRAANHIAPIAEYPHRPSGGGRSVVGGVVYRGERLQELVGAYLYGDYMTGEIWALRWDGKRVISNVRIARNGQRITSFGEDARGELLVVTYDGLLHRLARTKPAKPRAPFPTRLSDARLFRDTATLEPMPGMIPFSVQVPSWSDGARKERYLALPAGGRVGFDATGAWLFPVGTVLVETLTRERRLETRLLVHSPRGWAGYTYKWRADQRDATLTLGALEQNGWYYPSRTDCMACHTRKAGFALGVNTRQLNREHRYGARTNNQLRELAARGVFAEPPPEPGTLERFPAWVDARETPDDAVEPLARAYLDVNCAHCHRPPGYEKLDLRRQASITRANPGRAELLMRMTSPGRPRMPPLATSRVDERAVAVVKRWLAQQK